MPNAVHRGDICPTRLLSVSPNPTDMTISAPDIAHIPSTLVARTRRPAVPGAHRPAAKPRVTRTRPFSAISDAAWAAAFGLTAAHAKDSGTADAVHQLKGTESSHGPTSPGRGRGRNEDRPSGPLPRTRQPSASAGLPVSCTPATTSCNSHTTPAAPRSSSATTTTLISVRTAPSVVVTTATVRLADLHGTAPLRPTRQAESLANGRRLGVIRAAPPARQGGDRRRAGGGPAGPCTPTSP